MKIKNILILVLSLFVGLSALRAVPTDPSAVSTDPSQANIFTNEDSGKSITINASQGGFIISLSSEINDNEFSFMDSSLVNGFKKPFTFNINGMTSEGTEAFNLALSSSNSPIYLVDSSEDFPHFTVDGTTDADGNPNINFDLTRKTSFTFFISRPGSTKLTFTNGDHTYTYNITINDDTPKNAPAQ